MAKADALARLTAVLLHLMRDECGQDLVEYGLVGLLIAVAAVVALGEFAGATNDLWTFVIGEFTKVF